MCPSPLDEARIAAVIGAVGAGRFDALVADLGGGIAALAGAPNVAAAHRLQGAAGTLGLPALAAALGRVESALADGDAAGEIAACARLHDAVRAALSARASR